MTKPVKWPLTHIYEVYWRDSCSNGGWRSVEAHRADCQVGPMRSIGYLLRKDTDVVQLVQSMSGETQHIADIITIPRENVTAIKKLKR